jgi:predicted type IV restriction endonuclease
MDTVDEIETRLKAAIEDARKLETRPPNEACTCEWVIRPLLEAAGYAKHEIVSQGPMSGGGIPDYTILPDTEWTWYLEAKTWDKSLENGADAVQALNYANAQGKRWVVLSNGRQWLLFDNHLVGVEAPQRLVVQSALEDEDFLEFMKALSKPSVITGNLEQYVLRSRVKLALDQQLHDQNSEVIRAITGILKNKLGIQGVQPSHVVEYFSSETPPDKDTFTLSQLYEIRKRLAGTRPAEVFFPDGSGATVQSWRGVAIQVVKWLAEHGKLPELPFESFQRGKWFLAKEDVHKDGRKMTAPAHVDTGRVSVYVETYHSADNIVRHLESLCKAVGESTDGFRVKFSNPPAVESNPQS